MRFSRWITPEVVAIRFDTHFFLAAAPDGADPQPDGGETVDLGWFTPRGAIEAHERDEILLVFPTIKTLEQLGEFAHRRRAARVGGRPRGRARRSRRWSATVRRRAGSVTRRANATKARRLARTLTVAVTGPTGDIGRALLRRLDAEPLVERVLGMARRPFDPAAQGLEKTEYRQGDVLDRDAVEALAAEADVLVHLAFIIVGGREETRSINLEGSRNVFEAARGVGRLVYTSSVAAYGFHTDNPQPLTEDVPVRGTDAHYYSAQKAELEADAARGARRRGHRGLRVPPVHRRGRRRARARRGVPGAAAQVAGRAGAARTPARRSSSCTPTTSRSRSPPPCAGEGEPGVYNLAGAGTITVADLARAFGWHSVPLPPRGRRARPRASSACCR